MPQRTCIYCKQDRDVSAFNREHVIPEAFGSFEQNLTLLRCVCFDCNDEFGRTIDLALGRDSIEALLRFFHGVKSARQARELRHQRLTVTLGKDDPEWAGCRVEVSEEEGKAAITLVPQVRFTLRNGNSVFMTEAELVDETKPLPEDVVPGRGVRLISNSNEMDERLTAILAKRGIAFTKDREGGPPPSSQGRSPVELRMRFDAIILRSVAKIAFNYLTWVAGAAFVLGEAFDITRAFIRYGTQSPYPLVIPRSEPILADEAPSARWAQGHLLTVNWAGERDAVVGQVSLFNGPTYSVSLARGHRGLWVPLRTGHYFDLEARRISPLVVPRRRS
jgi:hypothetical protein